jgi:peptidyl-prolyl cis-trans isomerase SurA
MAATANAAGMLSATLRQARRFLMESRFAMTMEQGADESRRRPKKQTVASNASHPAKMRIATLHNLIAFSFGWLILAGAVSLWPAAAQNIVVLVNDEPITSFDIAQRQRWMARTGGSFGEQMKALLTGDRVNQIFRQKMMAAQPRSQAEAQQAAERIKKELIEDAKRQVLSGGGGSSRQAVIDALIEDKLKLQAAKKLDVKITDKEVEENLAARAAAGVPAGQKPDLTLFYHQFEADGINRRTIQEIIRAQLAWRDVIRKKYGPRIFSAISEASSADTNALSDVHFDVRVLRLAVPNAGDQRAVGERMLEAESLKEKFRSCAELPKEAKLVAGATVKTIDKAKLSSFPKDVQPLIEKVSEGQMTPPVLVGNAVESYALCRKGTSAKAEHKPDARQLEFERFSRSFLQEIKQTASIDYRS